MTNTFILPGVFRLRNKSSFTAVLSKYDPSTYGTKGWQYSVENGSIIALYGRGELNPAAWL